MAHTILMHRNYKASHLNGYIETTPTVFLFLKTKILIITLHSFWFLYSDKECRSVVDIALIIDSSGSIGHTNWEKMKRFVKSLVSKLDVSASGTHIAAIAYSTNPVVELRFWNTQSTDGVNLVIDQMPWQRGYTYTDKALQLADSDIFQISNGMRRNVAKVSRFSWSLWSISSRTR